MSTATILRFPKPARRGRRKGPDPKNPPVILSAETPEPVGTFNITNIDPEEFLAVSYYPADGPKPWRASATQVMLTAADGATFVFEKRQDVEKTARIDAEVKRLLGEYRASTSTAARLHQP